METSIWTVLVTAITVLGSASAWRFYEKKSEKKKDEDNFIKQDCRERIAKLETLLSKSSQEKEEMREMILELTKEVAAMGVKVEFLTKENDSLNRKSKSKKTLLNE